MVYNINSENAIALMKLISNFFGSEIPPNEVLENTSATYHYNQGLYDSGLNASLYLKLHYIQHKLLKHFDLNIYAHFEKIGLQPQLYLLRWIRVLFSREFYIDQTIQLWDELFSSYSLIEFIEYISIAMIYNVRDKLLERKDVSAMTILLTYPKHETDVQSLADTARKIQKGLIKLEFDKELYSQLATKKVRKLVRIAQQMFKNVDQESSPSRNKDSNETRKSTYEEWINDNQPGIRVPGYCDLTLSDKLRIQQILKVYKSITSTQDPIRMGYLVKRGGGKGGLFSRKTLKLRWFVIENEKLAYYK
ncbi:RabGAP/TBC domain-containing protein, partial [Reticulomyxa filosa]